MCHMHARVDGDKLTAVFDVMCEGFAPDDADVWRWMGRWATQTAMLCSLEPGEGLVRIERDRGYPHTFVVTLPVQPSRGMFDAEQEAVSAFSTLMLREPLPFMRPAPSRDEFARGTRALDPNAIERAFGLTRPAPVVPTLRAMQDAYDRPAHLWGRRRPQ